MDSVYITRRELRKYVRGATIGFLVMLSSVGYALSTKPDYGTLRSGLVSSCNRVNVLRAQSNLSDTVSFKILASATQRERALVKGDPENAKIHRRNAVELGAQLEQLAITKLTDCGPAVNDPNHYVYPIAVPIGDPDTGKLKPGVEKIVAQSRARLAQPVTEAG
jgi:hypothetical protein